MPCFAPFGATAPTRSPVRKPLTLLIALADVRGKPYLSIRRICLELCPVALTRSGLTLAVSIFSGVLFPTHAASIQCALGKPLCARLNFVNPPEPVSIGNPMPLRRLRSAHLVVLTAAASFSGFFACASTSGKPYSAAVRSPFSWLCLWQAIVRLETRFDPPLDRGMMCSTSRCPSQGELSRRYAHRWPN